MANIFKQLRELKGRPEAGAFEAAKLEEGRARLMLAVGHDEQHLGSTPVYYSWILRSLVSKPLAIGVTGFALMTSGWMTTVSASTDSLPGDRLYSVKLIAEKAQLQLASLDRRAVLHTEFAERRLIEATELRSPGHAEAKPGLVQEAMDAYKKELESAHDNLKELKAGNDDATVTAANEVQQKLDSLEVVIDAAVAASTTPEASAEALSAKEPSRLVEEAAVEVVVEVHEDEATPRSEQEVNDLFRRQLGSLEARGTFDRHRVEVIRKAIEVNEIELAGIVLPDDDKLTRLEHEIELALEGIPSAMNSFALGGVRTSFEMLKTMDVALLGIEGELAGAEIAITSALTNAAPQVEESEQVTPDPLSTEE